MTSILLRNGYVVTVDPDRRVFPNGYVHVIGERIAAVGPMDQFLPAVADEVDEVLDAGGKLVIPGLINLHDHHWASLFKGFDEGEEMEPWLVSHVIPIAMSLTPGDLRIASYVSSLEMLRYGVTCSVNHLANVNDADSYTGMARAGQEVGVRQVLSKEVRGTPIRRSAPTTPRTRTSGRWMRNSPSPRRSCATGTARMDWCTWGWPLRPARSTC